MAGEPLFDRLLAVLAALMSPVWVAWLKPRQSHQQGQSQGGGGGGGAGGGRKGGGGAGGKALREVPPFDRETAQRMMGDLLRSQLEEPFVSRVRSAFPFVSSPSPFTIAASLHVPTHTGLQSAARVPRGLERSSRSVSFPGTLVVPSKAPVQLALPASQGRAEVEVDPWTLLEEGSSFLCPPGAAGMDGGTQKANYWLKGAVRTRRTKLTYSGSANSSL